MTRVCNRSSVRRVRYKTIRSGAWLKLSKEEANRYIKQVYRILNTRPEIFRLRDIRKCAGTCEWYEDQSVVITLNYKHDILSTLIHECLHHSYPEWSESRVLKTERAVMGQITSRQAKNLIKKFAEVL